MADETSPPAPDRRLSRRLMVARLTSGAGSSTGCTDRDPIDGPSRGRSGRADSAPSDGPGRDRR